MVDIYIWRKLPLPFLKGLSITEHEFFSHLFGPTIFFNQKRIFFLIYKNALNLFFFGFRDQTWVTYTWNSIIVLCKKWVIASPIYICYIKLSEGAGTAGNRRELCDNYVPNGDWRGGKPFFVLSANIAFQVWVTQIWSRKAILKQVQSI